MRVLVTVPNFNMVTTFSGQMKNIPVALSIKPSTVSLPMFFYQKTMKHLFYFSKTFLHTISVFFINSKSRRTFRIIRTRVSVNLYFSIITLLPFSIEMIQHDWLWSGHMIIKEMFYIPIKLKPELARASMTTSDVNNQ